MMQQNYGGGGWRGGPPPMRGGGMYGNRGGGGFRGGRGGAGRGGPPERRDRSRSPLRGAKPKVATGEPRDWETRTDVNLDFYNSDLNLQIDNNGVSAKPMFQEGFAYMWAGARATYGVKAPPAKDLPMRVWYEVKVGEKMNVSHLPKEESNPHVLRVGWSVDSAQLSLGEEPKSWGYGGTGKKSVNCKFENYGRPFSTGDVVGCYLEFEPGMMVRMAYTLNGQLQGNAFKFPVRELADGALFPHVYTKNLSFEMNFGQLEKPWFPAQEVTPKWTLINKIPVEQRVRGKSPPEKIEDCEIIMMCGLPGAGKTYWSEKHVQATPEKRHTVLGSNAILDKMKVMGLPRKRNYHGRWDTLIEMAMKCLNKFFEIAPRRKRNYILDQTNVYPNAQRRKMRNFEAFHRKAVVIVPKHEEFLRRVELRTKAEGKEVPEAPVMEMKANFRIPADNDIFEEITFTELPRAEAEKLVAKYNTDGQNYKKAPPAPPSSAADPVPEAAAPKFRPDRGYGSTTGGSTTTGAPRSAATPSEAGSLGSAAPSSAAPPGRSVGDSGTDLGGRGAWRGGASNGGRGGSFRGGFSGGDDKSSVGPDSSAGSMRGGRSNNDDSGRGGSFRGGRGGGFGGRGGFSGGDDSGGQSGNRGGRGGGFGAPRGGFGGEGEQEDFGSDRRGRPDHSYGGDRGRGFGDRGRGFGDRGRGFGDRGRGFGDRGRGFGDRGRGFGDRGRGFGDRGRGFGDRGRGFGDRGRGFGDRGRGFGDRGGSRGGFGGRGGFQGPDNFSGPDRGPRGGFQDQPEGGFDDGRGAEGHMNQRYGGESQGDERFNDRNSGYEQSGSSGYMGGRGRGGAYGGNRGGYGENRGGFGGMDRGGYGDFRDEQNVEEAGRGRPGFDSGGSSGFHERPGSSRFPERDQAFGGAGRMEQGGSDEHPGPGGYQHNRGGFGGAGGYGERPGRSNFGEQPGAGNYDTNHGGAGGYDGGERGGRGFGGRAGHSGGYGGDRRGFSDDRETGNYGGYGQQQQEGYPNSRGGFQEPKSAYDQTGGRPPKQSRVSRWSDADPQAPVPPQGFAEPAGIPAKPPSGGGSSSGKPPVKGYGHPAQQSYDGYDYKGQTQAPDTGAYRAAPEPPAYGQNPASYQSSGYQHDYSGYQQQPQNQQMPPPHQQQQMAQSDTAHLPGGYSYEQESAGGYGQNYSQQNQQSQQPSYSSYQENYGGNAGGQDSGYSAGNWAQPEAAGGWSGSMMQQPPPQQATQQQQQHQQQWQQWQQQQQATTAAAGGNDQWSSYYQQAAQQQEWQQ